MSNPGLLDPDVCYRAVRGKDSRFDGVFYSGVSSTGIYCRPSCPAITPKKSNLSFYRTAAAAQEAGFRACKRCRPDTAPGSPEWNVRGDLVGRAMRLIADGVVDRQGVAGLAAEVGYSERQLNRQLVSEVGVGPSALARAQRARTARLLLETSSISISDVAFASGFFEHSPVQRHDQGSLRRHTKSAASGCGTFTSEDAEWRAQGFREGPAGIPRADERACGTGLSRESFCPGNRGVRRWHLSAFLDPSAWVGVAALSLAESSAGAGGLAGFVECELWLDDLRDLTAAVQRCRRMLDLDSDPLAIDEQLARDPLLRPLIAASPGHRMPGSTDPNEVAFRVVIGQQVSTTGARTVAGRLVAGYGLPLRAPVGSVTHTFPAPGVLAEADPADFAMPVSRKKAIKALAQALADESIVLNPGSDWDHVGQQLLALHGIGPWTVAAIRMRGLGDPDVFLPTDLGIVKAMAALGQPGDAKSIETYSQVWRPWRSYTTHHLWAFLDSVNGQTSRTTSTAKQKGRS